MKLKNKLFLATGCGLLLLASCQNPKEEIIGKWQFESYETPAMDSMAKAHIESIDTMTQVDSTMALFMGTTDLDSIKAILKEHAEDYKQQQKDAATMSAVSFLESGYAIFHSGPQNDSSKWEIIGKDKLILSPTSEMQREAGVQPDTAFIESIGNGKMKLKLPQGNNHIFVNLHTFTTEDSLKANELFQQMQMQQMMQEQMLQQMQQEQDEQAPVS